MFTWTSPVAACALPDVPRATKNSHSFACFLRVGKSVSANDKCRWKTSKITHEKRFLFFFFPLSFIAVTDCLKNPLTEDIKIYSR